MIQVYRTKRGKLDNVTSFFILTSGGRHPAGHPPLLLICDCSEKAARPGGFFVAYFPRSCGRSGSRPASGRRPTAANLLCYSAFCCARTARRFFSVSEAKPDFPARRTALFLSLRLRSGTPYSSACVCDAVCLTLRPASAPAPAPRAFPGPGTRRARRASSPLRGRGCASRPRGASR